MTDPSAPLVLPDLRLKRRRLLQLGAAGAAATWLGPLDGLGVTGTAQAAALRAELRRSVWLGLTDPAFQVVIEDRVVPLTLTEVADLPIATEIPALHDHDAAFVVRFGGATGLAQGTRTLRQSELGTIELFLVPVGAAGPDAVYEAVIDRTIRIAGVNEDGVPTVVVPQVRSVQPAPAPGAVVPPKTKKAKKPKVVLPGLRRAILSRPAKATTRRQLVADLTLDDAAGLRSIDGKLLLGGKVVARAAGTRRSAHARLRFAARRTLPSGRYELVVTMVSRTGHVVRVRKIVRVA